MKQLIEKLDAISKELKKKIDDPVGFTDEQYMWMSEANECIGEAEELLGYVEAEKGKVKV